MGMRIESFFLNVLPTPGQSLREYKFILALSSWRSGMPRSWLPLEHGSQEVGGFWTRIPLPSVTKGSLRRAMTFRTAKKLLSRGVWVGGCRVSPGIGSGCPMPQNTVHKSPGGARMQTRFY